ncbi:Carboxypeptidase [Quillaja saponaria]|uniref:Carboxypeptidase n=1 Tax=Quillaja saponaria TaxID=32244 RepID=A0AAD7VGA6_QUISA|nr:Carboxypeptidase [Quillaja saponaria]
MPCLLDLLSNSGPRDCIKKFMPRLQGEEVEVIHVLRTLKYQGDSWEINIIPLISDLLKEGLPVLLYSGDQDSRIPLTQTRIIANNLAKELKLVQLTNYGPCYDQQQVAGWSQSFGGLRDGNNVTYPTFATVRGAAHEVPFTSPSQALTLFRSFLSGSLLPRPKKR